MHAQTFDNAHFKFSSRQDVAIKAFIMVSLDILSLLILPEKESKRRAETIAPGDSKHFKTRQAKAKRPGEVKLKIRIWHRQGGFGSQLEQCGITAQANEARGAL